MTKRGKERAEAAVVRAAMRWYRRFGPWSSLRGAPSCIELDKACAALAKRKGAGR